MSLKLWLELDNLYLSKLRVAFDAAFDLTTYIETGRKICGFITIRSIPSQEIWVKSLGKWEDIRCLEKTPLCEASRDQA